MRKLLTVSLFALIIVSMSVSAFANGLSLNSIGPKALGMGGAFVGLADDGSAIYWNPAGLVGQANSIHISVADVVPLANYNYDAAGIDSDAKTNNYLSPNIFANYSSGKLAYGLGIYVPAGLGAEYDGKDLAAFSAIPGVFAGDPEIEWMSKIGVISFSPSVAYQMTDRWSMGLSGNVYYGMFDLKRLGGVTPNGAGGFVGHQYDESSTGLGYGATIGTMFKFSEKLNLGLTYRTPVKVDMSGTAENSYLPLAAGANGMTAPEESDFDREVTWPTWIAAGIAAKPFEKLTLTFDVQWSDWEALDKLVTEFDDETWALMLEAAGENEFILDWESKTQVRLGLEYQAKPCLALRTGYYYDPAPAPDETLNILFPSGTYSALTGGLTYAKGLITVDFGIEYLFGEDREVEAAEHNMPGTHGIDIFAMSLGLGYNF